MRKIKRIFVDLFRKKENKFDHIMSLGYNCEPMFRFVRYFGFEESSIFNWVGILNAKHLIFAINNFDNIGENGFLDPTPLYECKNSHVRFHGNIFNVEENSSREVIEEDKKSLYEKLKYLKEKFKNIAFDNSKKLYMMKLKSEDVSFEVMDEVQKAFEIFGAKNFKILFIIEKKDEIKTNKKLPYIIRTVKYFADDNEVVSKKYLKNGFDKIFDEFWMPNIKKKNKVYKFDKKVKKNG